VANNTIDALASAALVVTFSPTVAGPAAGTITISSDDPSTPNVQISVTGQGIEIPASLVVSPARLMFLGGPAGLKTSQTLVVRNPGSTSLQIDAPRITGPNAGQFSTDWENPLTLAAYSTNFLTVSYTPKGDTLAVATLAIDSPTAGIQPASVALIGIPRPLPPPRPGGPPR
jgi:hypothetical protein